ncbi:MAG: SPOR domain-containing protein [Rhodobacteraceae bacterium]|nr:SPOR domain-containing protein [Paracoccaceae bacterium]
MAGNDFREDDFYDGEDEPRMSRGKVIMAVLAVLIVAGFGTGIWYAYDQGVKKGVQLAPPIISADTSAVKEKPEDPGGMDIPHQDKQVFGVLKSGNGSEKVEKLMAPPEEAKDDPASVATTTPGEETAEKVTEKASEKVTENLLPKVTEATSPVTEPAKTITVVPADKPAPAVEEKVAAKAPAPTPKVKSAVATGPLYRVQLGSFRTKDAAEKQWQTLRSKYGSLLSAVKYRVQDVAVKDKGTFHRLQAGTYKSRASANKLCDALKAKKQDCLVVSG